jgi:predicted GTPase
MPEMKQDISDFASLCAVILSIGHYNFDKFSKLKSFAKISKAVFDREFADFWEFNSAKEELFEGLERSEEFQTRLFKSYDILFDEGILSLRDIKELKSVFSATNKSVEKKVSKLVQETTPITDTATFQKRLSVLFEVLGELFDLSESKAHKARIDGVKKTLNERSFSIGVTGVMNAGKSTLLNALLRSNVLGTAVVPETANLTVLKYSKKPYAVVNFWDKSRWSEIEKSGEFLPQIAKFVEATKAKFGANIDEFITNEGKKLIIKIGELELYTSAIKSDMKCNLVQSVELYTNLEFLKDGVMIVDTPGLDDPVIKREEITKEYLGSCDLMMHLMNANQSATAKDVEFIIDALTYQGISRLLVVITRIDSITKEELKEVIEYTKSSIKAQLEKRDKGALFGDILNKLEFIAVAGKLALMHRIGDSDEALRLGYSEEQTGIFEIERYLNDTLFGFDSPKANLLIASNAKTLAILAEDSSKMFIKESENLNKSSNELKLELENIKSQNAKKEIEIEKLLLSVRNSTNELEKFSISLLSELDARANALKNKIFSRVYDDVKYELNKNRKKPTDERVSYMLESGIKDGMIDLTRDYRFGFSKRSVEAQEKLLMLFEDIKLDTNQLGFDVKAFFASLPNGVNLNFATLVTRVLATLKRCSKSNLEEFGNKLDLILSDGFLSIKSSLDDILQSLNVKLISDFTAYNEEPLRALINDMNEEVERLNEQIKMIDEHRQNAKIRDAAIQDKLSKLKIIQERLSKIGAAI